MRSLSRSRLPLALVAFAAASAIVLGVASGAESGATRSAANANLLLGVTGDVARFKAQTGQDSSVDQAFLGWGQGQTYGAPFAGLFPKLGPIPMLHLGTGGGMATGARKEVITPAAIAQGKGDSYLIALNHAIASWGKGIYIRPMGEMNNPGAFYGGYNSNGTPKDADHAPARYREAFARIYVILHGGTIERVNAKLQRLGLPAVQGPDPLPNPFPQLRVVFSPLAGSSVRVAGNAASNYYPGQRVRRRLGRRHLRRERRRALRRPRGALQVGAGARQAVLDPRGGPDRPRRPRFVKRLCSFVDTHPATELFAYYDSKAGSRWDLGSKPQSRVAYRNCMTPLAGAFPDWAAANAPGGGASVQTLTLTPRPAAGAAAAHDDLRDRGEADRPDPAVAARLRRRHRDRRPRRAARDGQAHLRRARRLPGDAHRLPVPALHDDERPLLHLRRRHGGHDPELRS